MFVGFFYIPDRPIVSRKRIDITKMSGTMEVVNHSIQIQCDGLYLFFLMGNITLQGSNDTLTLSMYRYNDRHTSSVWKEDCKGKKTVLQKVLMSNWLSTDEVFLEATLDAPLADLKLGLIMLTPRSYCSSWKVKSHQVVTKLVWEAAYNDESEITFSITGASAWYF